MNKDDETWFREFITCAGFGVSREDIDRAVFLFDELLDTVVELKSDNNWLQDRYVHTATEGK